MARPRSALLAVAVLTIAIIVAGLIWGGPLVSGALFLLLPAGGASTSQPLSSDYKPVHKGHVDLATGLYLRADEDVILDGAVPFIWRRMYLANDRVSRHFGIGTTHNAEWYLIGDVHHLESADLILEDGRRIRFDRTSPGNAYDNAMFIHTASSTEFYGARLGWVGLKWALRFDDGRLALFQACSPGKIDTCSIVSLRNSGGRTIHFRRDDRGTLRDIQAGNQQLTPEYDDHRRITRAASARHQ